MKGEGRPPTGQPDGRHLRTVERLVLFETAYRSPQRALWELNDDEWLKATAVAPAIRQKRPTPAAAEQGCLFA